jgi:hypothetical protein
MCYSTVWLNETNFYCIQGMPLKVKVELLSSPLFLHTDMGISLMENSVSLNVLLEERCVMAAKLSFISRLRALCL